MNPKPRLGLINQREAAGQTLTTVSDVIGVSTSHYAKMEKGQAGLSLERAAKLAAWFGCKIEDLL